MFHRELSDAVHIPALITLQVDASLNPPLAQYFVALCLFLLINRQLNHLFPMLIDFGLKGDHELEDTAKSRLVVS